MATKEDQMFTKRMRMRWRGLLVLLGAAFIVAASATAVIAASSHQVTHAVSGRVRLALRIKQPATSGDTATAGPGSGGQSTTLPNGAVLRKVEGTFSISGVLRDAGSLVLASSAGSAQSPTLFYSLSGKQGSLRLAVSGTGGMVSVGTVTGDTSGTPASSTPQTGRWRIVAGTRAYVHLHGGGQAKRSSQLIVLLGDVSSD
jgi:hypothetical protein